VGPSCRDESRDAQVVATARCAIATISVAARAAFDAMDFPTSSGAHLQRQESTKLASGLLAIRVRFAEERNRSRVVLVGRSSLS
jgi:hypothetical protein